MEQKAEEIRKQKAKPKSEPKPEPKKAARKEEPKAEGKKLPTEKIGALITKCRKDGIPVEYICNGFEIKSLYQMTEQMWMDTIRCWPAVVEEFRRNNGTEGEDS